PPKQDFFSNALSAVMGGGSHNKPSGNVNMNQMQQNHQQAYTSGGGSFMDMGKNALAMAAVMQAMNKMGGGGSGMTSMLGNAMGFGGSGHGGSGTSGSGGQSQLVGMAMAEAVKLFQKQNKTRGIDQTDEAEESEVAQMAARAAMQMFQGGKA
ncbi:hypothetical protein IWQ61_004861, partial [Dispira simplex]